MLEWRSVVPDLVDPVALFLGLEELARVAERVDGRGWVSEVARHQRDWRRRLHVIAPSREAAMRWAEQWTRANLERIQGELPTAVIGPCSTQLAYPASNPAQSSPT